MGERKQQRKGREEAFRKRKKDLTFGYKSLLRK